MKKKAVLISVAAVVVVLSVVVCAVLSSTGPGYFRATYDGGEETLDFYKDGTIELYGKDMLFDGTYEKIEKNTYEVRINALIVRLTYTAVKDGKTITLTNNADESKVKTYTLKK